jgi:hypothetical protein
MLPALERQLQWMVLLYTSKTAELRRGTVVLSKEARERSEAIREWARGASVEDQRRTVQALWRYRKMGKWMMPLLGRF